MQDFEVECSEVLETMDKKADGIRISNSFTFDLSA